MAIVVGGSVGGGLIMPLAQPKKIHIRSGTEKTNSDIAEFWSRLGTDYTSFGYETAVLSASQNTVEQTITNITGQSGVLTHVITPEQINTGVMTIRVTIDGTVKTFASTSNMTANQRLTLGFFKMFLPADATSEVTGYGSELDKGFFIGEQESLLVTPISAIMIGVAGIKFETSCKVTIQGSSNIKSGSTDNKAYASWMNLVPSGL